MLQTSTDRFSATESSEHKDTEQDATEDIVGDNIEDVTKNIEQTTEDNMEVVTKDVTKNTKQNIKKKTNSSNYIGFKNYNNNKYDNSSDDSSEYLDDIPIFILNRYATTKEQLREVFKPYGKLTWIIFYGKVQDGRPHAIVILDNPENTEKILQQEIILDVQKSDGKLDLEVDYVDPVEPKNNEESCKLFVSGLPNNLNENKFKKDFIEFLSPISKIKYVNLPKEWNKKGIAVIGTFCSQDAGYIVRLAKHCEYKGSMLTISFARKKPAGRNKNFKNGRRSPNQKGRGKKKYKNKKTKSKISNTGKLRKYMK